MFESKKYDYYKNYLKKTLSNKRYIHSINVANEAYKLALKFNVDEDKAYFSGLLHDICKEMQIEEQEKYVLNSCFNVSDIEKSTTSLWHAIAGAEFLFEEFKIEDKEILNAIRYHTIARAEMTEIEKIVYLADLISEDRQYKDVKRMREICYKSLELGMLEGVRFIIMDLMSKGKIVPVFTFEAYNYYLKIGAN